MVSFCTAEAGSTLDLEQSPSLERRSVGRGTILGFITPSVKPSVDPLVLERRDRRPRQYGGCVVHHQGTSTDPDPIGHQAHGSDVLTLNQCSGSEAFPAPAANANPISVKRGLWLRKGNYMPSEQGRPRTSPFEKYPKVNRACTIYVEGPSSIRTSRGLFYRWANPSGK